MVETASRLIHPHPITRPGDSGRLSVALPFRHRNQPTEDLMTSTAASRALVAAGILLCATAAAHAQSARADFEKLGLMGTHTLDCSQPVSESNGYIIYRALDATRVQRDTMTGPTTRMFVSIAESASSTAANEITVTGTSDGKKLVYIIKVDGQKHRVWTWTEDGVKSVENGVWTEQKYEMPWLNKCS
jgi:hypothetical protein